MAFDLADTVDYHCKKCLEGSLVYSVLVKEAESLKMNQNSM